jgi:hypothetical protein
MLQEKRKQILLGIAALAAIGVFLLFKGDDSNDSTKDNESVGSDNKKNGSGAADTDTVVNEATPVKVNDGKEQGLTEEIGSIICRICKFYAIIDERSRDSITLETLIALLGNNKNANHIFDCEWNKDRSTFITCNEVVHYFLKVKTSYGQVEMENHLKLFESAAVSPLSANVSTRRGSSKNNESNSNKITTASTAAEDLPSSWIPIVTSRITSIFRRIDLNGDGNIDKNEILALHGGDTSTTESMFADLDTNNDGCISPQEFVEYFFRVLKRCEEKDKKNALKNSPTRVNASGALELDPSYEPTTVTGISLTKGRKMIFKIMSILEHKLSDRDEKMSY